jgi:hypothetical protein
MPVQLTLSLKYKPVSGVYGNGTPQFARLNQVSAAEFAGTDDMIKSSETRMSLGLYFCTVTLPDYSGETTITPF